ncbi:MAG: D-alanyl-D-alanine carboxypeptidase/D-alanyl-D-alanine-endopeptidase [Rhodobacteraceae bacterium]|nr:D-alanyl-D-alanine carboxypeptidase/D-alanyl-D-alanine-endopeptidase [Paracoccaceae bacterium]
MRQRQTRRNFLGGLMAVAGTPALANAPLVSLIPPPRPGPRVPDALKTVVDRAGLGGAAGVVAVDLADGQVIEAMNPDLALPPASVAKVVTALYALETLGSEYRFVTELIATGPIVDGRLEGDLYLVGGGDPTLDTEALGAMAKQLKAAGVFEVKGTFAVWDGALPTVWSVDADQLDHVGYNPAISGLNLNFNRVHFEWKRQGSSYAVTMEARTRSYRPGVTVATMDVVDRAAPVYEYRHVDGIDRWSVARPALGTEGARWLPVRKPAAYSAEVFEVLARSHGIVLKRGAAPEARPDGFVIARHESAPMVDLMRSMLRYSTNLTAEVAGMAASQALGARPQTPADSAARMSKWASARYGLTTMAFEDHSGLGYGSAISARDMTRLLTSAARSGGLAEILRDVRLQDSNGNAIPEDRLLSVAKTGTLNFVSALAGYAYAGDREIAYAIFTADTERRDAIPRDQRDRAEGVRPWARRSRRMQRALIARWGGLPGA